jgi:7,8-dihydropterin-6-yl-methyl-4-(beta-D-ribofuranosyl)aminobenzene 5'-phosphate synthase
MKVTIVYDNCSSKPGLKTGWGFSAFIEPEGAAPLLFDTGADGNALLSNMKELCIDPRRISAVVISHAHGDHTGGLSHFLEVNTQAGIYVPASVRAQIPGRKIVWVDEPVEIAANIYSTGELRGVEQSLAVKTGKGILVVTGCSHPGVDLILEAARRFGNVYGIIGGLHGFSDFDQLQDLSLISPCHCTQHKKELERIYPEQYQSCGTGMELEL